MTDQRTFGGLTLDQVRNKYALSPVQRDLVAEIDRLDGALLLGWNPPALWAGEPLMKLLSMVAGAVSGVFMREHPDMVMPTEEVIAAIDAVLQCDPRPSEERQDAG